MWPDWAVGAAVGSSAVFLLVGIAFALRQNARQRIGGGISWAKAFWLTWAVYVWFVLCPLVASLPTTPTPIRWVLGLFAANMWARGLVELYLLFVTKSWTPPMGIAHDIFSFLALLAGCAWTATYPTLLGALGHWELALLLGVTASLALETYYAFAFLQLTRGRTTGDDAVWFADPHDPRYARINLHTALANLPLYALWLGTVLVAAGL